MGAVIEVLLVEPIPSWHDEIRLSSGDRGYSTSLGVLDCDLIFENVREGDLGGDWHPVQEREREVNWKQVLRRVSDNHVLAHECAHGWVGVYGGSTYSRLVLRPISRADYEKRVVNEILDVAVEAGAITQETRKSHPSTSLAKELLKGMRERVVGAPTIAKAAVRILELAEEAGL